VHGRGYRGRPGGGVRGHPEARGGSGGPDHGLRGELGELMNGLELRTIVHTALNQKGCGEWLEIGWEEPAGTGDGGQITPEDVMRTAEEIHADLLRLREEV